MTVRDIAPLDLVRAVTSSGLKPVIDTVFPFEHALDAWHHFDDRAFFGKVVISY
ncbi:zinc-binding dehydrogenase [Caballeronia mineralivorans]|uniref:zinc-binding dehydrogenase n=1 Tax=Caballeronia mineralivorans TaxID=2010198 RepID=UPI002AFF8DD8|nr:zinc-binding dehydrogenase [Caballeronia mineralivorans]